jgi:hypothetical protein
MAIQGKLELTMEISELPVDVSALIRMVGDPFDFRLAGGPDLWRCCKGPNCLRFGCGLVIHGGWRSAGKVDLTAGPGLVLANGSIPGIV